MWAGGEIDFVRPIRVGDRVERVSTIRDVTLKEGRSGPLCFVVVVHEVKSDGHLAVKETQDIVYRDVPVARSEPGGHATEVAPAGHDRRLVEPSAALLFRYSALTFNSHRIHYDKTYATEVERYPGLVVHGPLQATLLCLMAMDLREAAPKLFAFRSVAPIFDNRDFTLNANEEDGGMRLWTARTGGPVAMEATARW